MDDAKLQLNQP